jgi:hydroxymethylglutaryl-CoA lyase
MPMPASVRMVEVGPRDGLQNEASRIPAEVKLALIERLQDAGLRSIEVTSFVSPKWVPQMADHREVMAGLRRRPGVSYPVLTPNLQGFEAALAAGADEVGIFTAATDAFSRKNTNCSIEEGFRRFEPIMRAAAANGVRVRGSVSCALGCPYEGEVDPETVAALARRMLELGCYEISVADTIGVGTPLKAKRMIEAVAKRVPIDKIAGHYHDTWGQALANIYASLELGVTVFDSSVAGLGGCPYAPGATGNVATEDVVYLLQGLDIETGIDLEKLAHAGRYICEQLGRPSHSRAGRALLAKRQRSD